MLMKKAPVAERFETVRISGNPTSHTCARRAAAWGRCARHGAGREVFGGTGRRSVGGGGGGYRFMREDAARGRVFIRCTAPARAASAAREGRERDAACLISTG